MEVEAKYRVDDLQKVAKAILTGKGKHLGTYKELNRIFDSKGEYFYNNDRLVRLRTISEGDKTLSLFTFKGKNRSEDIHKRVEIEFRVPKYTQKILHLFGLTEHLRYEKNRSVYRYRSAEVFLDEVKGLGTFVEVEGDEDTIHLVASELGLNAKLEPLTYAELIRKA